MIGSPKLDPAEELQRCGELLITFPFLALPTAIGSLVIVIVVFAGILTVVAGTFLGGATAGHAGAGLGFGTGAFVAATLLLFGCALTWFGQAMVIAAAPDVLAGAPPDLPAAAGLALRRLPDLAVAMIVTLAVSIVPLALCFVVIGIPLVMVLGYFLMYVPAAVIVGNEGGVAAVKSSIRIASRRVGESFIGWLGCFLVLVAGTIANGVAVHIPLVNLIAGFAIGGFTSAYAALVTARFYLALRDVPAVRVTLSGAP